MTIFKLLAKGIDVNPLMGEINSQPELWNNHFDKITQDGTPHKEDDSIWLRYNDPKSYDPKNPRAFHNPHTPVWYPQWYKVPALKPIVFDLMRAVEGEMLGAIYIMRLPAGKKVTPHKDWGWHVNYYDNFYLQLEGESDQYFWAGDKEESAEKIIAVPGDLYTFDNRCTHGITNNSSTPRTCVLISIRNYMFRKHNA